jgi:hypothetical protein
MVHAGVRCAVLRRICCVFVMLTHAVVMPYVQAWSAGALVGFVIAFNCLPAALELLTFLFVARVSFFAY